MSEKKTLKRAVKATWDSVKVLRQERGKLYTPEAIATSADQLAQRAEELKTLAAQLSALSAMPAAESSTPKRKRKAAAEN